MLEGDAVFFMLRPVLPLAFFPAVTGRSTPHTRVRAGVAARQAETAPYSYCGDGFFVLYARGSVVGRGPGPIGHGSDLFEAPESTRRQVRPEEAVLRHKHGEPEARTIRERHLSKETYAISDWLDDAVRS